MKQVVRSFLALSVAIALGYSFAMAQDNYGDNLFEEFIRQNLTEITASVADPFAEVFSTGVTGGIYRGADTHKLLGFDIGARGMFVLIPTDESTAFDTADVAFFPIPVAQAAVGLPMDAEIMLRGFAVKYEGVDVSLLGVGLKKNFKPLIPIPMFPDVAAMISYHRFKGGYTNFWLSDVDLAAYGLTPPPEGFDAEIDAGNLINSTHWSFDVIASKKFSLVLISFQPYIGFGVDKSTMDYDWEIVQYKTPLELEGQPLNEKVSGSSSVTTTRLTLGLDISPIPFIHVFADYNIGKFNQATVGAAISFR